MTKIVVYLLNFFAKISLNIAIILAVLLLVFTCARMVALELNVHELESEISYYKNQKPPVKKSSGTKPI